MPHPNEQVACELVAFLLHTEYTSRVRPYTRLNKQFRSRTRRASVPVSGLQPPKHNLNCSPLKLSAVDVIVAGVSCTQIARALPRPPLSFNQQS